MNKENRRHPRFCPDNLTANISIEPPPPDKKFIIEGAVIDMSYTGIKIKLNMPIHSDISKSVILINLTLPESGIPLTIRGIIKHLNNRSECGLQYSDKHLEHKVDDLMFECIKQVAY